MGEAGNTSWQKGKAGVGGREFVRTKDISILTKVCY